MFIDTTFCIDLMRERRRHLDGAATKKLGELSDTPLFVSVFVLCELQAGARLSRQPQRELRRLAMLTEALTTVFPDATFPVAYGEVEAQLRRQGTPIPVMDLLIGTLAKSHGLPLLTRDPRHFSLIDGLVVETY